MTNTTTDTEQNDIKTREGSATRLSQLAPAIAKALGFKVEPDTRDAEERRFPRSHVRLLGPDDQTIYLSASYPYGKLDAGVIFPDRVNGASVWSLPYGTSAPKISCTLSKSAEQVARDIQRRLLPEYLPLLAQCKACVAETLDYRAKRDAAAEKLAKVIGAPVRYESHASDRAPRIDVYHSHKLREASMDIDVGDDEVRFERLRVSHDEAEAILSLLVKLRTKGGK
jgi:hypothetical protein